MAECVDVLVLGGGIIGLTCAHALAEAGMTVEVVDRGEFGREASWAGAGIIPPGNFARAATPLDQVRACGAEQCPDFSRRLLDETGIDNEYTACGGVEFLTTAEWHEYVPLWRAEGLTVDWLAEPLPLPGTVSPPGTSAWYLPGFAQVRNPRHVRALVAACDRRGVRLTPDVSFERWRFRDGIVTGVTLADGSVREARHTLVASGAWADELLAPLGQACGVHPVRGQVVLFRGRRGTVPHILLCGKRYLVPRRDGRILVGSTEEPEAGFTNATTPEAVAELTAFARALVPALHDAEVEAAWSGLRPGSADGLPTIGVVPGHPNVIAAVGHGRAGIQLSLGTAALVRALVTGETPPADPAAFAFGRPAGGAARPAFRS